jgi:hypothetical protein
MSNSLGNNGGRFYSDAIRPVLITCSFSVQKAQGNGLGIQSLKGPLVRNVFMNTSATPGLGANGYLNPNPAAGFALIQLKDGYSRYLGGFSGFVSPLTGSTVAINSTALTIGQPYVIASVGHATAGAVTIAPVADSSGSLASTWFSLYDAYGNTFIIWFYVTGVGGSAPIGVSGTLVQQTIAENASADNITTALAATIALLPSGIAGTDSFTTSGGGTATMTITSTQTNPYGPLPGGPADGVIPTGFTFAVTKYNTNLANWQGVGLPKGVIPNVGAAFVATATGSSVGGGSTGLVEAPSVSGCLTTEVVGDANQTLAPIPMGGSPNSGGWILVQFLAPTQATVDAVPSVFTSPFIPTAPANGSVVGMSFYVEQSSVVIAGQ